MPIHLDSTTTGTGFEIFTNGVLITTMLLLEVELFDDIGIELKVKVGIGSVVSLLVLLLFSFTTSILVLEMASARSDTSGNTFTKVKYTININEY